MMTSRIREEQVMMLWELLEAIEDLEGSLAEREEVAVNLDRRLADAAIAEQDMGVEYALEAAEDALKKLTHKVRKDYGL